jgi:hypothetical protein
LVKRKWFFSASTMLALVLSIKAIVRLANRDGHADEGNRFSGDGSDTFGSDSLGSGGEAAYSKLA